MEYVFQSVDLTKKFGSVFILDGINIHVPKGSIYGLVGPNGAGKTTLMRILLGSSLPTAGYIAINGKTELVEMNLIRKKIGSIIEKPTLYPTMSAIDNLISRCKLLGIERCREKSEEMLNFVGLENTGKKKVKNFSLGMKQRLAIGLALLGDPEILVLDEPTNGLDPIGVSDIRDIIKKLNNEGVTILISSHILAELSKFATHYGVLYRGQLLEEISDEELAQKSSESVLVSFATEEEASVALRILLLEFGEDSLAMPSANVIKVFSNYKKLSSSQVTKILLENNLNFLGVTTERAGLEDYFLNLVKNRSNLL